MPVILFDPSSGSETLLNVVNFEPTESAHFVVSNASGKVIVVSYIPYVDSSWTDTSLFEVHLLVNPYLNAENDVFELYADDLEKRVGWIIPISALVSNENDFSDYKNLNKYKFISYCKLLDEYESKIHSLKDEYILTDLFHPSVIVCIIHKDAVANIPNFSFNKYSISLYQHGYCQYSPHINLKKILNKSSIIQTARTNKWLRIKKQLFVINDSNYIDSLFKEHLLITENRLVRFIFLYQIIEQLMDEEFTKLFDSNLSDYQNNIISKNDLKEEFNTISRERDLIKKVFNNANINTDLFTEKVEYLFNDISYKVRKSMPDKIYDLRNLITHRYRNLIGYTDKLNELIEIFEDLLVDYLIKWKKEEVTL